MNITLIGIALVGVLAASSSAIAAEQDCNVLFDKLVKAVEANKVPNEPTEQAELNKSLAMDGLVLCRQGKNTEALKKMEPARKNLHVE